MSFAMKSLLCSLLLSCVVSCAYGWVATNVHLVGQSTVRRPQVEGLLKLRAASPSFNEKSLSSDENGPDRGLTRRDAGIAAAAALAGLVLPQRASAFCPPNCNPDDPSKPLVSVETPKPPTSVVVEPQDGPPVDLSSPEGAKLAPVTDKAFFDLAIGDENKTSRVVVALYGSVVPQTVNNFKQLVKGGKGYGYKGTEFYRVVKGLQISAGDVLKNQGRSGKSAIKEGGEPFEPESFRLMHSVPYMLSMVNTLDKQVDSRFFISTRPQVDLGYSRIFDGKYVAFGRVVEGMDTILKIDGLETKPGKGINAGRPKEVVIIKDCGIL